MPVPFRIVDVFTPRPLAGNQLCVVPEPVELDAEGMQAIAREIGFSETTFVTEAAGDRYAMRIFTPGSELRFAGHPTLGTAFVLVSEGRVSSPATQVVAAGEIPVGVDLDAGFAWMTQLPAEFGAPFEERELIAGAIGLGAADLHEDLPISTVSTGLHITIVPVRGRGLGMGVAQQDEFTHQTVFLSHLSSGAQSSPGSTVHTERGDLPSCRAVSSSVPPG